MKREIFTIILCCLSVFASGQKEVYLQKNNILYYQDYNQKPNALISARCKLDVYYPKSSTKFSTLIWFHGGGLTAGNKEIPAELKDKGICVVSVGYRLSPEVTAPGYIEDAAAAVAWAFRNIEKLGGDTSRIFLSGHSAGAYLASMITLDKSWLDKHKIDANRIAGLISLSGQAITHFTIRKEKGLAATKVVVDELAPLYFVRADAPPILLITGDRELELLGRYEENAYLMRMMTIAGHRKTRLMELQGYGHDMTKPSFPLLLKEIDRIVLSKNIGAR
ncbi:alpha/beta hydrolase [Pedobacter lithocola]|uniref:Alpha/beta hydrolase n=1 Tax=Pedobacter lithocola TaxID=1908239 RepID=A0ABV8P6J3_9SPHI